MKRTASVLRRFLQLALSLPEVCRNDLRFRVFVLLPRWFRMPDRVRVAGRTVRLHFPDEEGIDADFIACFLRNDYGLGHSLGEVRTILDIGANVGFFSLASREHYPNAVLHAYEPNPRIQRELRENSSGLDIHIFPEAVGARDGTVTMIDTGPSDQARTRFSEGSIDGVRQVSLLAAIERIGGSVDLLKLDCEGAEWEILDLKDCWKSVCNIRMEYHFFDGKTEDHAIKALSKAGYEIIHAGQQGEDGGLLWARRIR